jgi:hypothetical protein
LTIIQLRESWFKSDFRFRLITRPHGSYDVEPSDIGISDAVFVDGDHARTGVVHDTVLARSCVRKGGLIIWHDYNDQEASDCYAVRLVLDDLWNGGDRSLRHIEHTNLVFSNG